MNEETQLRFGNTCLDLSRRRLLLDGKPAKLGARAFDLLAALAQRRERAVTKHELFELVWPGVVVEENNLQVQISTLRKLLGPDVITTIPGRGYQLVAAGAAASPPPDLVDAAAPARSGVPVQQEQILGRDAEVHEVTGLLREHALVSVVGAGGIGKTRLALAVAGALQTDYADGVRWVELASINEPGEVAGVVAQALRISPTAHRTALESVLSLLRRQTALLVLDNCEHLLDAVAELVAAVQRECRGVRVLVTSQENLKLHGEHVYRLGGLALPSPGTPVAADAGAVALFVARARAADPRVRFDDAALATAEAICRALDGIPLAIELAAARVPLLGIEGLYQRLGERFRILTGGARRVLRRHQTLRAALEWSHSLLSGEEQAVLRRLGVFVGGFPLELAQAVASDDAIDRWHVVELIGQLIDKSLVVADSGAMPRYRLLETTRAFALECLAAASETERLLARHAEALTDELAALNARYLTLTADAAIERATRELDNVRAALHWSESAGGDRALGVALMGSSYLIWYASDQLLEGVEHCRRLLPLPDGLAPDIEANFWLVFGRLGYLGSRPDCYDATERAADLLRRVGNRSRLVDALIARANIGARRGDLAEAQVAIAEAESILTPDAPANQRAAFAVAQCTWNEHRGEYEQALAAALRQAACYREIDDPSRSEYGVQVALSTAALCEAHLGRFESAIERLQTAISELRRLDARLTVSDAQAYLSIAHGLRGEGDDLHRALALGRTAWPEVQRYYRPVWLLAGTALVQVRLGQPRTAALILGKVDRMRIEEGLRLPFWDLRLAELDQTIRSHLGPERASALAAEGAALTDDAVAAFAFSVSPGAPPAAAAAE